MSTMPEIVVAMAGAYARKDLTHLRALLLQAAAKLGGERGQRIQAQLLPPAEQTLVPTHARHLSRGESLWQQLTDGRSPFVPSSIAEELVRWEIESRSATELFAAGERTYPLLLVGPPRCGKTSCSSALARNLNRPAFRLRSASVVESHMGDTARLLRKALDETLWIPGVFLIDEIDGLVPARPGGDATDKERNHTVGCLLTWLEELVPGCALVATTNRLEDIDEAVAARFTVVRWPEWSELDVDDRVAFASSHGMSPNSFLDGFNSYAELVAAARRERIANVLASIGTPEAAQ